MSDFEDDYLREDDDSAADDWEIEEELEEQKKKDEEDARLKAEEAREEDKRKKQEKKERMAAMAGELAADALDIQELDGADEREYKDRLTQHEVEMAYQDTNTFGAKPINTMAPSSSEECAIMGEKIGGCLKTFRNTKFFGYALNLILQKSCDKLSLEQTQELSKKLNVIISERARQLKEGDSKKKVEKEPSKGETTELRGNAAVAEGEGEYRNDLKGDGRDLDDFM
eukprot:TRINITY_DN5089_c0_g4_i1.p2 TRINITY_DN5089_c0_g4~~TRINITY_DN5089_c0_g4_i1.p2  ORF type:complete len:227 (+),score=130.41 TRINITY_DN5089_c0_g4_i1:95-775(+)